MFYGWFFCWVVVGGVLFWGMVWNLLVVGSGVLSIDEDGVGILLVGVVGGSVVGIEGVCLDSFGCVCFICLCRWVFLFILVWILVCVVFRCVLVSVSLVFVWVLLVRLVVLVYLWLVMVVCVCWNLFWVKFRFIGV